MSQPKPQARPEGTTIQADGKKSLNDYATTFYHNATLGAALGSVQQKLSVTDPTKPLPKGTTLFIPGMLVGQGQPKSGGVLIDAAYRRTGAVVLVEDPIHTGGFIEGPAATSIFPVNIRQIVNERSIFCGNDSKGWVRNVWFAPAGSMRVEGTTWGVATILTIKVRFLPNPLNKEGRSQRTDPPWGVVPRTDFQMHPASVFKNDDYSFVRSGVDNEKHYSGKLRESPCSGRPTEYTITKLVNPGDPPIALTILFGIGGGDQCEVSATAGDPKKAFQSVVTFTNWRRIYYEIIAPESMTGPLLELGGNSGKQFAPILRNSVSDHLENLFILFKQLNYLPIKKSENPVGYLSGPSIGFARNDAFVSTPEFIRKFKGLNLTTKTNSIRFYLFDGMIEYTSPDPSAKLYLACIANNQEVKTSLYSIVDKDRTKTETIAIPPAILTSSIVSKNIGDPSYDLSKFTWKVHISEPSLYKSFPGINWVSQPRKPGFPNLYRGSFLIRLQDTREISLNTKATLVDAQKKPIEILITLDHGTFLPSQRSNDALAQFIKNHLVKKNIRTGRFNLEINYIEPPTPSDLASSFPDDRELPWNQKDIDQCIKLIQKTFKDSKSMTTELFTHPGLDATGNPLSGSASQWVRQSTLTSFSVNFPTSIAGYELEIGDLLGEESPDNCPIEITFEGYYASPVTGGRINGTNIITCKAGLGTKATTESISRSLNQYVSMLLHEIGHAMGITPFSSKLIGNRARLSDPDATDQSVTRGYDLPDPIPGLRPPANIDEIGENGKRGTYYMDDRATSEVGKLGIRKGHSGPHCASGLSSKDLDFEDFQSAKFKSKPDCVMFGFSGGSEAFCPICRTIILSRCLDDLQSRWGGRA